MKIIKIIPLNNRMFHIPKLCLIDPLLNTFTVVLLTKSSISMPNYLKVIILIILFFKRHKPKKEFCRLFHRFECKGTQKIPPEQ